MSCPSNLPKWINPLMGAVYPCFKHLPNTHETFRGYSALNYNMLYSYKLAFIYLFIFILEVFMPRIFLAS